ncbi:methyltransferase domain-containing protein [Streptomyces sp. AD2-2]|nr:methyltransferase domain-containing protein [Streptomyces sp. AD2-2]
MTAENATGDHRSWGYTASTGLAFTREDIVEAHFQACAGPYRAALDLVGVRPGWRVLDAGCGSGAFLPWLVEAVGPEGRVHGVDLAAENAERAAARTGGLAEVWQGDVLCLDHPDDSFDAVWCANTTQYLDDDQLLCALAEFRRVVRPGGVVAVKDLDAALIVVRPGDPYRFLDFFRDAGQQPGYARQLLRTAELDRWLERSGLTDVRRQTLLIEHSAPMPSAVLDFYTRACERIARLAGGEGWEVFLDPDGPGHPLRDPHGYVREGNTVALGVVR